MTLKEEIQVFRNHMGELAGYYRRQCDGAVANQRHDWLAGYASGRAASLEMVGMALSQILVEAAEVANA